MFPIRKRNEGRKSCDNDLLKKFDRCGSATLLKLEVENGKKEGCPGKTERGNARVSGDSQKEKWKRKGVRGNLKWKRRDVWGKP
jgi:hypothetical protein